MQFSKTPPPLALCWYYTWKCLNYRGFKRLATKKPLIQGILEIKIPYFPWLKKNSTKIFWIMWILPVGTPTWTLSFSLAKKQKHLLLLIDKRRSQQQTMIMISANDFPIHQKLKTVRLYIYICINIQINGKSIYVKWVCVLPL